MEKNKQKIYNHLRVYGPLTIAAIAYDLDMHDRAVLSLMQDMYYDGLIRGCCVDGYVAFDDAAEE